MDITSVTVLGIPLFEWLSQYGYFILLPLLIFEGVLTAFGAGILASVGVFNPWGVIVAYIVAKLVADSFIYFMARYATDFLRNFSFARSVIEKVTQNEHGVERDSLKMFRRHFTLSLFLAKVLPLYSFAVALLIGAGVVRMSPKKVYVAFFLGQPLWSAMIVGLGYFLGSTVQDVDKLLSVVGLVVVGLVLGVMVYYHFLHSWVMEKLSVSTFLGESEG